MDPCETKSFIFVEDFDDDDEDYIYDNDEEDADGDDLQDTFLVDLPIIDNVNSSQESDFDILCNPNHTKIDDTSTENIDEVTFGELIKLIAGVLGLAVIFVILLLVFVFAIKRLCQKSHRMETNPYLGTAGSYKRIDYDDV